jgi:putative ABC transport system permease protein
VLLRVLTQLRFRLRWLFRRGRVEQELDEELQYHLDREIEQGLTKGMALGEARLTALRALGAITQNKEACRDMLAVIWIRDSMRDLAYGARALRTNPGFSVVVVLALAMGIGANTAMFSLSYGVLLRPLPYTDPGRLAAVNMTYGARDPLLTTMSIRDYVIWKEHNRVFQDLAVFRPFRVDLGEQGRTPEQVRGTQVTAGLFFMLGVRPLIGRMFEAGDDQPAAGSLIILSESIWRSRFAASSGVLGQTILMNGAPSTVIGVMPNTFQFPRPEIEVWTNLILNPPTRYGPWFYRGLARLKPGVTFEQAQAEMNHLAAVISQQNPYYNQVTLQVLGLRDALVGSTLKRAVVILSGAVGLLLLIAVVNVANLMLARATVRQREMALRLSLGAGRGRLLRQLLTESVLLAAMGGSAGLGLAWGTIQLIRTWNPGNLPFMDSVQLDWPALAFMLFVSILAGILFGLAPALMSARTDLNSTIKKGGRSSTASGAGRHARQVLVIAEIALSLILLVGAGLLFRSFLNLQQVTAGFLSPPPQILTMQISPSDRKYDDSSAGLAFYEEVLRHAATVPGVELAAISDSVPPDQLEDADTFQIEGQTVVPGEMNAVVSSVTASSSFFQTLQVPLIKGRYFTEHDHQDSIPVAIVSEGFARRFFPGQDALGKRIRQGMPWMTIVGVVGNMKYMGLMADTDSAIYKSFAQSYGKRMFLVVRSSGEAARLAETLRSGIQSVDASVALSQPRTMEQALDMAVSRPRFNTVLLSLFAGIALTLASIGIYGLIAYWVAQRTHEIGIRMALGAVQSHVMRMVVTQGVSLAAIAIALGLGGAVVLTRFLQTMLFGVGATDMLTFVAASLGIMLLVLLATFVPALRATQVSPVVALRYE